MALKTDSYPSFSNHPSTSLPRAHWSPLAAGLVLACACTTACSADKAPGGGSTAAGADASATATGSGGSGTSSTDASTQTTTSDTAGSVGGTTAAGGTTGNSTTAASLGGSANGTSDASGATTGTTGIAVPTGGQYDNGFMPTTATPQDAANAYAAFKSGYLEDCGSGKYRVRWDEPTQTVSEGIAYGLLLSVSFGEKDVFDGLWQYYADNQDPNGLMHWQRGGCEGSAPSENSNNAATDADLDAAMALIMAECRFGDASYGALADGLIAAIKQHETSEAGGFHLLHPGDVFGGTDCLNASYFAPAYYRVFAARAGSDADRDFWLQLAADSYALIEIMDHDTTGFVPNWADASGNTSTSGPSGCNWYTDAHIFGSDAIRAPWRIAVDYLWFGTPEADAWLDKVTAFVKSQGITTVGRKFNLDGTPFGEVDHSIISLGAFANAAMASDQATADAFAAEAVANVDEGYFPTSLRGLYLLVSAGLFTQCGGT